MLRDLARHLSRFGLFLYDLLGGSFLRLAAADKAALKQLTELAQANNKAPGKVWIYCWPPIGEGRLEQMFDGSVGHIAAAIMRNGKLEQVLSQFPREHVPYAPNVMLSPAESMQRESHAPLRPEGAPAFCYEVTVPNFTAFLNRAVRERKARMWFMRPIYNNETNCVVSVDRCLKASGFIYHNSQVVETPEHLQQHLQVMLERANAGDSASRAVIRDARATIAEIYR